MITDRRADNRLRNEEFYLAVMVGWSKLHYLFIRLVFEGDRQQQG